MLKGFALIALCLATEAAFLFHAALPSGIPSAPPAADAGQLVRRAAPPARDAAQAEPGPAQDEPCDPSRRC